MYCNNFFKKITNGEKTSENTALIWTPFEREKWEEGAGTLKDAVPTEVKVL